MNSKSVLTGVFAGLMFGAFASNVDAANILVKCEKSAHRSKISVDGSNLTPGLYRCGAQSGSNVKTTTAKRTARRQIECDFDSNPNDVAAGATRIPPNFIQGGRVIGKILTLKGRTVNSDTSACRIK